MDDGSDDGSDVDWSRRSSAAPVSVAPVDAPVSVAPVDASVEPPKLKRDRRQRVQARRNICPQSRVGVKNFVKASVKRSMQKQVTTLKKKIETLQLKLKKRGKGKRGKSGNSQPGVSNVAFERFTHSTRYIGEKHGCSRDSVRRWPMKYAIAWNNAQDQMLRDCASSVQQAVQGGRRLMLVVDKSKWDEAKHTFSMTVDESSKDSQRMSWSVMRQRLWIGYWLTSVADGGGHYEQHYVEVVLPPVLMLGSNNAGCLAEALTNMPWHEQVASCLQVLRGLARVSLTLRECDAAGTNMKYTFFEQVELAKKIPRSLYAVTTCQLHGMQAIVKRAAAAHADALAKPRSQYDDMLKAYGVFAALSRQGNYFLRGVLAIDQAVDRMLRITHSPPLAENLCYRRWLCEYLAGSWTGRATSERMRASRKSLEEEWLLLANGSPFSPGVIWHHCGYMGAKCGCKGREDTKRRLCGLIRRYCFSGQPKAPSATEWTSQNHVPRWTAWLSLNNDLLSQIFTVAFDALTQKGAFCFCFFRGAVSPAPESPTKIGAKPAASAAVPGTTGPALLSLVPRHDVDNCGPLQDDDVLGFAKDIDWCPDWGFSIAGMSGL